MATLLSAGGALSPGSSVLLLADGVSSWSAFSACIPVVALPGCSFRDAFLKLGFNFGSCVIQPCDPTLSRTQSRPMRSWSASLMYPH